MTKVKIFVFYFELTFRTLSKLEKLDLRENSIKNVEADVFSPLVQVREIELGMSSDMTSHRNMSNYFEKLENSNLIKKSLDLNS